MSKLANQKYLGVGLLVIILSINVRSLQSEYAIGQIAHKVDVDQGSLRISVPLDLPKGVNNFGPNLELTYSSDNPYGSFLGMGWSLSGLSSIHLCMPQFYDSDYEKRQGDFSSLLNKAYYLFLNISEHLI
jgi:hypothetical protein